MLSASVAAQVADEATERLRPGVELGSKGGNLDESSMQSGVQDQACLVGRYCHGIAEYARSYEKEMKLLLKSPYSCLGS